MVIVEQHDKVYKQGKLKLQLKELFMCCEESLSPNATRLQRYSNRVVPLSLLQI